MEDINSENYYNILGISKSASDTDIKRAYRKLAMKYHPDKNKENNAEEKFKKINEAYSILSDNKKRTQYNQFGKAGVHNGANMSNFQASEVFSSFFAGNEPFSGRDQFSGQDPFSGRDQFSGQDPFKMFFGQGFAQQGSATQTPSVRKPNYYTIKSGSNILLRCLISSRENNGKHGIIEKYISEKKRYIIKLDDDTRISLKYENIQQIANVTIFGLENKMELNNSKGKIIGFNDIKNRYQISIQGEVLSLKSENIIIDKDVCVKLVDIVTQPLLNGKTGIILNYDSLNKKYLICIEGNRKIKVKSINVQV